MTQHVIVVGAGVLGAATACQLQTNGAQVTVIHDGRARATGASFGWINASFYLDHAHFRLRVEGLAAWQRWMQELDLPIRQCGCLCWDRQGAELRQQAEELSELGYAVEVLDQAQFCKREPAVANPPEEALYLPQEAAAEAGALADTMLQAAVARGAKVLSGLRVDGFIRELGSVKGIYTRQGAMRADHVLVAAGTGTDTLMERAGVAVPLVERPALVLKTRAVPPLISHVLVSEIGEVKQCADGSLMLPVVVGHQGDASENVHLTPDRAGEAALARLQSMFLDQELTQASVQLAYRPMPEDGLPCVGKALPGLYVAVMHSGITLAAVMAELIAEEMINGVSNRTGDWLAPYRPQRFEAARKVVQV
ncbi:MAG: FAD-binding oxidoreductase [Pseudomonadota bacterium]